MPIDQKGVELARQILNAACGSAPTQVVDLEAAVIRSLVLLTLGDTDDFSLCADPPQKVTQWLTQAKMEPVRGLLMATLRRWHELQQQESEP